MNARAGALGTGLGRRCRLDPVRLFAVGGSLVSAATFTALLALLVVESLPVLREIGWRDYLLGEIWFYRGGEFGVLPMVYGTAVVAGVALLLAAPVGLGTAYLTSEVVRSRRLRLAAKGVVELLAGVPSVVYGLLGILFLRDFVYRALAPFDPMSGDTLLTAGLLLAVMILPTVATLADDALAGVPRADRLAARALGLTRWETAASVVLPRALPGLVAAVLLALGRALGETIAVFLVVGRRDAPLPEPLLSLEPLAEPGQTLTSKLGGSETFIAFGDPLHWAAIVGLALVLSAGVLAVTGGGAWLATRMRGGRQAAGDSEGRRAA